MKKTELKDVYCVPLPSEWTEEMLKMRNPLNGTDICGVGTFNRKDRTEIPVSKFIDLLEDRIVGWRLEEIGFRDFPTFEDKERWIFRLENGMNIVLFQDMITHLEVSYNELNRLNISTFTELETLIRFLK